MNIKLGEQVHFDVTIHNPIFSGQSQNADETPRFWVFEEANDTAIIAASALTVRSAFPGLYRGVFDATAGLGFESQKFYNVVSSGKVAGIFSYDVSLTFYVESNNLDSIATGIIPVNLVSVTGSAVTVVNEINLSSAAISSIWNDTVTELTGVPQFPVTYGNMFTWMFERSRNYTTTASGYDRIYKDNGTTPLASSILSDDGSIFIRREYTS